MTLLGHDMFNEYIENVRSRGKIYFTSQEIRQALSVTDNAVRLGLSRLKRVCRYPKCR